MRGPQRLRALAARIRQPKPAGALPAPRFNKPPTFPTDALLPPSAELAVAADARPVLGPHRANTEIPIQAGALDVEWQLESPKSSPASPGTTVLGIDGDVIVKATATEDGAYTVTTLAHRAWRRREPDGCPCTAIYSECRCPVRP